jgi:shikimate dehydrogenase
MERAFFTLDDLSRWPETGGKLNPPAKVSVFGDPVAHSLSPEMHNPALRACGIHAQYVRIHASAGQFQEALIRIRDLGFAGTNVTIPHKFSALKAVDEADEAARRLGAVNTVIFRGGRVLGRNSDGPGFVRTIKEEFQAALRDLRVLVLGAGGGAGRAVAVQCALEGCARLILANRTEEKSRELRTEIAGLLPESRLRLCGMDHAALADVLPEIDLIVNGTSVGMNPDDPPLLPDDVIESRHLVCDMVYKGGATPLVTAAQRAGSRATGGLPMLLWQGVYSFEWWFGMEPPAALMREALLAAAAEG